MRRRQTPSTVPAQRKHSIYFNSIILLFWPDRCWLLLPPAPTLTCCVTLSQWVYLSGPQSSHLSLIVVFWSPCRFCLISWDSIGGGERVRTGSAAFHVFFWLCTAVCYLTWTKFSGSLKKVCQTLVRSKAPSKCKVFQSRCSWFILPSDRYWL